MNNINISFSTLIFMLFFSVIFIQCRAPAWYQRADVLNDRDYASASWGVDRNNVLRIYAIGGRNNNGRPAGVEGFDPVSNTWQQFSSMNTPRRSHASVTYYPSITPKFKKDIPSNTSIKIFVFGGAKSGTKVATNKVEEYNTRTDIWTNKASLSSARKGLAATYSNGKIYVFGGTNTNNNFFMNIVEEYNPATDTWTVKAPMPAGRAYLGAATGSDGKIYITGGVGNGNQEADNLWIYDPITNSWSNGPNLPYEISHHTSTSDNVGKIFVLGEKQPIQFDITSNTWNQIPPMVCGNRSNAASTNFFTDTYLIGGSRKVPPQPSSCVEVFTSKKY